MLNQTFKSFYIGMNTCRICGKEIGKTYSDKKLRCSSCRKSVENAIGYNERTVEYVEDELFAWKSEYKKLKKENKKLNIIIENTKIEQKSDRKHIEELEEENKKLNIKVASLEGEIKGLNSVIDKLREELSAYDREYFDEDKKAKNIFMEEDTLQELRDLGEI